MFSYPLVGVRQRCYHRGMRTKEELNSPEYRDDMYELQEALDKKNIKYLLKRHIGASPEVKKLIGYYPTGEWHIFIGDISVIRGMCSFGDYEVYGGKFKEPERFKTPQELIENL